MYVCIRLRRETGRVVRWDPATLVLSARELVLRALVRRDPETGGGTDGPVGARVAHMGGGCAIRSISACHPLVRSLLNFKSLINSLSEPVGLGGPLRAG